MQSRTSHTLQGGGAGDSRLSEFRKIPEEIFRKSVTKSGLLKSQGLFTIISDKRGLLKSQRYFSVTFLKIGISATFSVTF